MRKGYKFGVAWIAANDNADALDWVEVATYISTLLLADLFDKSPNRVTKDIVAYREKHE